MRKINRKKLNNKGFTLIELLAVIVILAIVVGIFGVAILNPTNSAKRTSLLSASKNASKNLNTWYTEDSLNIINSEPRKLGDEFLNSTMTGEWICLSDSLEINNSNAPSTLLKALGLSKKDILIGTTFTAETVDGDGNIVSNPTCSAIRYNVNIGGYEFLLVAAQGGSYYVAGDKLHFAYSSAGNFNQSIDE